MDAEPNEMCPPLHGELKACGVELLLIVIWELFIFSYGVQTP
jgi:hypothetical protein